MKTEELKQIIREVIEESKKVKEEMARPINPNSAKQKVEAYMLENPDETDSSVVAKALGISRNSASSEMTRIRKQGMAAPSDFARARGTSAYSPDRLETIPEDELEYNTRKGGKLTDRTTGTRVTLRDAVKKGIPLATFIEAKAILELQKFLDNRREKFKRFSTDIINRVFPQGDELRTRIIMNAGIAITIDKATTRNTVAYTKVVDALKTRFNEDAETLLYIEQLIADNTSTTEVGTKFTITEEGIGSKLSSGLSKIKTVIEGIISKVSDKIKTISDKVIKSFAKSDAINDQAALLVGDDIIAEIADEAERLSDLVETGSLTIQQALTQMATFANDRETI